MYNVIAMLEILACAAFSLFAGVIIGQWANLLESEWVKLNGMPRKQAYAKVFRWAYYSVKRFFVKLKKDAKGEFNPD